MLESPSHQHVETRRILQSTQALSPKLREYRPLPVLWPTLKHVAGVRPELSLQMNGGTPHVCVSRKASWVQKPTITSNGTALPVSGIKKVLTNENDFVVSLRLKAIWTHF